ncbi:MAG: histone family protein [Candidatus Altiarchaeota archaeon]
MAEIPLAPVERILRKVNIDRVGEDAVVELRNIIEEYAIGVGERAAKLAKHAGRVTLKADDIKLAR